MKRAWQVMAVAVVSIFGASTTTAQVIHVCAQKNSGAMRVVEGADDCRRSEKYLSWPTFPVAPQQRVWVNDPVFDIQADWRVVRTIEIDKASSETGLLIEYDENAILGVPYPENGLYLKILIDGEDCVAPGPIEKEFAYLQPNTIQYLYITDNLFTRATCTETAAGSINAGRHEISVLVRKAVPCTFNQCNIYLSAPIDPNDDTDIVARLSVEEVNLSH